ncbi:hypothetical protein PTSG_04422 [Salpingoeca rosetta]|uniref:Uncharacterized protein n=1 Tax=Salpingoeca rosetta (strain ATCC 50818 / BSB-021) TaxID=946362 RepID=F2U8I5_SALR5|nr:uncharacterized protein PTSG_04422 [Salpingoeca rosetta]EGD72693.1 hypothetical protein PTSG_04422 [Salpingoeca rosetta]|eukprot:XP_004994516.1 hypothetical protein PTSG_04422 [Salpingoeca rosetta]
MAFDLSVLPDLTLPDRFKHTASDLSRDVKWQVRNDALARLDAVDPILRHVLEVKVVRNQRRNFLNLRVRQDYATLIFQHPGADNVRYCFFISDKLEPFITITVLSPDEGKLGRLTAQQVVELEEGITRFKTRFGIVGESYHYTPLQERRETDEFVRQTSVDRASKAHSTHFHLKMRIATEMYKDKFPVLQLMNFDSMRRTLDHIKYNYSRTTVPWDRVKAQIQHDAIPE